MMEFLRSPAGMVTLVIGAVLALMTLVQQGTKLYHWLKTVKQGYPHEDVIEKALLPFLDQAIMAAYKASENLMDTVGERLHGMDKAMVARLVYQMLPDTVSGWQWKRLIGEEKFARWLQTRFNTFADWWDTAEEGILKAILPEGEPPMVSDDTYRIKLPDVTGIHPE